MAAVAAGSDGRAQCEAGGRDFLLLPCSHRPGAVSGGDYPPQSTLDSGSFKRSGGECGISGGRCRGFVFPEEKGPERKGAGMIQIPADLDSVLDVAWGRAKNAPGSVLESEARFLGIAAACTPADGAIVEIGNGEGRSTVMLATVAGRYGRGPVVWIPSD